MNQLQLRKWRSITLSLEVVQRRKLDAPEVETLVSELEVTEKRIKALHNAQVAETKERASYPATIAKLRSELREKQMYRISRRGPSLMKWAPGAEAALRLPHPSVGNAVLLAAAEAMYEVVAIKPSLFIKDAHFPKDFLARFRAAIRALARAVRAAAAVTSDLTDSTGELDRLIRNGRAQLRVLDGVLKPYLRENRVFREQWREKSLLPGQQGRPKKKKGKKAETTEDE